MAPDEIRSDRTPESADRDINAGTIPEIASESSEPIVRKPFLRSIAEGFRSWTEQRRRQPEQQVRAGKALDRSKTFLALAVAVVVMLFVFLGMFSSSTSRTPDGMANKTTPNLGRPEAPSNRTAEGHGSVTPLLNADTSGQDGNADQISADDVKATGRFRARPQSKSADALASTQTSDPALDAYRQAKAGYSAPHPLPPASTSVPTIAVPSPPPPAHGETDPLKKASIVFVSSVASGSSGNARPEPHGAQPTLLESRRTNLLPTGTRLVARLQSAVSTAVKTPVVAAIEYNYERDGEIVVPAGARVFGDIQQANRNGDMAIHFHTLQMPDGSTEKISAGSMSLSYGPLRGAVSGSNRLKRVLVRSVTGVGTMASYLVGGPGGFGGLNGQLNNSMLLRERIASNAGLAGEQELSSLAFNENVVISMPANTRFFVVLLETGGDDQQRNAAPASHAGSVQYASGNGSALPSAQELRELIELKTELNRIYQGVSATKTSSPPGPAQQP